MSVPGKLRASLTLALLLTPEWLPCAAATPHFDAAISSYRAGDCAAALRRLSDSEKANEQAPERPFYQGVCFTKQGEWTRAGAILARYCASHPTDARAWYWLAQAQLYSEQFSSARESIRHAIENDGKSADAYRTLGEIELQLKNNDAAYQAWLSANKLNPMDSRITYYIGRLFFEADLFDESASWFRQTLKLAPTHFAAMTYLAMCAERLNFQTTAAELYQAAIEESKKQQKPYPWAFLNYAKFLRQSGKDNEAFAMLEDAENLCPEAHGLALLGQMLATANQTQRAEAVLRRAIAMDDSVPDAHYRLAMLLRLDGRTREAETEMQKFLEAKDAEERNKNKVQAIRKAG